MQFIITLLIAIIPIFLLCVYIYHEDRYEKESIPFLIMLFLAGVLCAVLSSFVKNMEQIFLNNVFSEFITFSPDGMIFVVPNARRLYSLLLAVFSYAVTDAVIIVIVLFIITFKNKNFNSLFDGIVYAVYIIMGFTLVEVVAFGYGKGWDLFALKCLTVIPMRMFTGVVMGYFYSQTKIYHLAHIKVQRIPADHSAKIKNFNCWKWGLLTVLVPWMIWGVYEFATLMGGPLWRYLYYFVLMVMYFYSIRKITNVSNNDALFDEITDKMVSHKNRIS